MSCQTAISSRKQDQRSVRPNIGFARSWTFGTKLDFRDREVGLFLWSYLDFLAIPKIQLRDIPTTKVQLRSSKLMFLPASFRTDFVVHYYVELVHRFPNIDAYVGTIQVHGKPALLIGLFTYFYESNILLFLRFISIYIINHYSLRFIANSLVKQYSIPLLSTCGTLGGYIASSHHRGVCLYCMCVIDTSYCHILSHINT